MATSTEPTATASSPAKATEASEIKDGENNRTSEDMVSNPENGEQEKEQPEPASEAEEVTSTEQRPASPAPSTESGEASEDEADPPLPNEPVPEAQQEDGWEYHWNPNTNSYWFYNRFTQVWQQENPRVTSVSVTTSETTAAAISADESVMSARGSVANGYNPAIHGNYDPNAWYAVEARAAETAAAQAQQAAAQAAADYTGGGYFNRITGQWQGEDQGSERHSDEAKSRRQMNAYFDVDAAANMHDGRSLKAERAGKKPTRAELKAFKEKRKAKKEEKRRAWLRD